MSEHHPHSDAPAPNSQIPTCPICFQEYRKPVQVCQAQHQLCENGIIKLIEKGPKKCSICKRELLPNQENKLRKMQERYQRRLTEKDTKIADLKKQLETISKELEESKESKGDLRLKLLQSKSEIRQLQKRLEPLLLEKILKDQ